MRIYLTSRQRRPDPEPLVTDDRRTVLVGIAAWTVALAACLIGRGRLGADRGWWTWTAVAGLALGGYALWYLRRRDRRRAAADDRPSG